MIEVTMRKDNALRLASLAEMLLSPMLDLTCT